MIDYSWFYGALSQSLAALIGIMGMFTVYRLQIQLNRINDSYDVLRKTIYIISNRNFDYLTNEKLLIQAKKELERAIKEKNESNEKEYGMRIGEIRYKEEWLNILKIRALMVIIYLCLLFVFSLICLVLSNIFSSNINYGIGSLIVTFLLLIVGISALVIWCANCLDIWLPKNIKI